MTMNTLPNNWSQRQLDALNALTDMHDAYTLATQIISLLNDTTPEATQVKTDLANLARAQWTIVKTYGA